MDANKKEDIDRMLEERLEEQLKQNRNFSNRAVTEAIKAFEDVYNTRNEKDKST